MNLKLQKRGPRKQAGPLSAFALGMIAVAILVVASMQTAGIARGYWKTREKVEVPAKVEFLKDTFTERELGYSYQWQGRQFTGERLSLFHTRARGFPSLLKGFKLGDSIKVWIDPSDPSYSVFDRHWSWSDFGMILAVLLISALASVRYLGIAAFGSKPKTKRHFGKPLLRLP